MNNTAGKFARCSQGHVFDVTNLTACPICGETLSQRKQFSELQPSPLKPSSPFLWGGMAVLAVAALAAFVVWLKPAPPNGETPVSQSGAETPSPPPSMPTRSTGEPAPLPAKPATDVKTQAQSNGAAVAMPPAASPVAAVPAPSAKRASEALPDVQPQLPKSAAVQPAATLLPAIDYPDAAVTNLQTALRLSDFLIDMLSEFAAADTMSSNPGPDAVAILTKLSDKGLPVAKFDLANIYFTGQVVGRDDGQGLRYLREAADAGVGPARMKLAKILVEGQLVLQDRAAARELVILATREGINGASVVAGQMGIDPSTLGPIGPELTDMALQGNDKVVELANAFIADRLASGYLALAWYGARFSKDTILRRGVPEFARKAASLGVSNGMNVLANLYRDDVLVPRNDTEAYLWITLAHRFCNQPDWCAAEEKLIAKLGKNVDMAQVESLRSAISQIMSPASDITK